MQAPSGPLQAFAHMQRALRDADQRLMSMNSELSHVSETIDGKLLKLTNRVKASTGRHEELQMKTVEVEELAVQMFREHEHALTQQREDQSKQHAELLKELEVLSAGHKESDQAQALQASSLQEEVRTLKATVRDQVRGSQARTLQALLP